MQSFVMHTYEASAMPPYHAYAYDSAGNPLSERQAKEISERLQFWPSGARDLMMMVLPAEAAPDLETIRRVVGQPREVVPAVDHERHTDDQQWRASRPRRWF